LTTAEPHALTTGQVVSIDGLQGIINVTNPNDESFLLQRDLSRIWFPKAVEVTGPNSFRIDAGGGGTDAGRGDVMTSISEDAAANSVELALKPGVAYEYMLELSQEVAANPWICVPHLASDDYVRQLATLIATSNATTPETTVYIELSNEMWNWLFSQTWHGIGMARELGLRSSSQYFGKRSREIFDMIQEVFDGYSGIAPKLHRVLGSQSVNPWITEQVILGAGGAGTFDSVAIAPYFAAKPEDIFERSTDGSSVAGVTVDDVLELCVEDIFNSNRQHVMAQKAMADKYGASLVAYEGGQHLGGQGPDPRNGGRMENDADYQNLMIAANRDPRMHNVYQAYFKQWSELVPGGVFAHFSFIGLPSKWGSWGVKETYFQQDTVEESPKWMSVKGIAQSCSAVSVA